MKKNNNEYANKIKQQNQQAEAKKNQASGQFATPNTSMNEEFGAETDVNQVKQQLQQAEAKKNKASGQFANSKNNNTK